MNPTDQILSRFEELSAIPRASKNEAAVRVWLTDWAARHSFASKADSYGNLVVQVPASKGFESRPVLILQGHMDMVCQKTDESTHDFARDPIQLVRKGDWLHAKDTTLGADNGVAVAMMMALAEDESINHPALELLFTVEEEIGLFGAEALDPSLLTGKSLINLDSEEDGVFTVGCAGGGSVNMTVPVTWTKQTPNEIAFEVKVKGLQGGHSGGDINKQRGNANKIIGRVLDAIQRETPIRLSALKGGTARNAIPRSAEATFAVQGASWQPGLQALIKDIQAEYSFTEKELSITVTERSSDTIRAASEEESLRIIRLLNALPNGVAEMSAEIAGFVETSSNIGVMELKDDGMFIVSNHRSAVYSRLEEGARRVEGLAWLAGAKTERTKFSNPWQPNMDSRLLKKCTATFEKVTGKKAKVELAHGGLECGIISERCGGMDTISLGPTIENPHSPSERLHIPSLANTWDFLKALLLEM